MIKLTNVNFSYNVENPKYVLQDINLNIKKGEMVAILGHNGSGKSTLAKILNSLLVPNSGKISVDNISPNTDENIFKIRSKVGMVFQNPDNQIVTSIIEEDVAFALENLGVPQPEMVKRVENALKQVDMLDYRNHSPAYLSGGQKQRVAIAGILAMNPDYIIFDEATAMLDPIGRDNIINIAKELNKQGKTIIFITHNLDEISFVERAIIMAEGRIIADGKLEKIDKKLLKQAKLLVPKSKGKRENSTASTEKTIVNLKNLSYTYNIGSPYEKTALKDVNIKIKKNEITSIIGHTGSGKSTLIQIVAGLLQPTNGSATVFSKNAKDKKAFAGIRKNIGMIFQYPENQIFEETVFDEIAFAPKNFGLKGEKLNQSVFKAMDALQIPMEMKDEMPHHLSGGWKRKIAIASVLAFNPKFLILDEPTAGLDPLSRYNLIELIKEMSKTTSIVFISHYVNEIRELADRLIVIKNGKIAEDGIAEDILKNHDELSLFRNKEAL